MDTGSQTYRIYRTCKRVHICMEGKDTCRQLFRRLETPLWGHQKAVGMQDLYDHSIEPCVSDACPTVVCNQHVILDILSELMYRRKGQGSRTGCKLPCTILSECKWANPHAISITCVDGEESDISFEAKRRKGTVPKLIC